MEAEVEIAASTVAGTAVLQPVMAISDVVPHSLQPSLTYSHFNYPHPESPWFIQILCL